MYVCFFKGTSIWVKFVIMVFLSRIWVKYSVNCGFYSMEQRENNLVVLLYLGDDATQLYRNYFTSHCKYPS